MLARVALTVALVSIACGGSQNDGAKKATALAGQCTGCGDGACKKLVRSVEDAADIANCTTFRGDLLVSGAGLVDLSVLSKLRVVEGGLAIGPTSRVTSTTGLASLERVTRDLEVSGNFALYGAFFPSLVSSGGLFVRDNPVLASVSLHKVETAGAVTVERNRSLLRLDLSGIARVDGDVTVANNPLLSEFALPQATAVSGKQRIELGVAATEP